MHICIILCTFVLFYCRRILIDTGESGKDKYIKNLKNTLESCNALLKNIIITHWHQDHVGGIMDVINHCPCGTMLWQNWKIFVL